MYNRTLKRFYVYRYNYWQQKLYFTTNTNVTHCNFTSNTPTELETLAPLDTLSAKEKTRFFSLSQFLAPTHHEQTTMHTTLNYSTGQISEVSTRFSDFEKKLIEPRTIHSTEHDKHCTVNRQSSINSVFATFFKDYNKVGRKQTYRHLHQLKHRFYRRLWKTITLRDWVAKDNIFRVLKERQCPVDDVFLTLKLWSDTLNSRVDSNCAIEILEQMKHEGSDPLICQLNENLLDSYNELRKLKVLTSANLTPNFCYIAWSSAETIQDSRFRSIQEYLHSLPSDAALRTTLQDLENYAKNNLIKSSSTNLVSLSSRKDISGCVKHIHYKRLKLRTQLSLRKKIHPLNLGLSKKQNCHKHLIAENLSQVSIGDIASSALQQNTVKKENLCSQFVLS